jgi:hypothetical protein
MLIIERARLRSWLRGGHGGCRCNAALLATRYPPIMRALIKYPSSNTEGGSRAPRRKQNILVSLHRCRTIAGDLPGGAGHGGHILCRPHRIAKGAECSLGLAPPSPLLGSRPPMAPPPLLTCSACQNARIHFRAAALMAISVASLWSMCERSPSQGAARRLAKLLSSSAARRAYCLWPRSAYAG